ncbi:gamma-tubulin complex component 4-like [Planoprotostelium fungivorum]|uniref:Spindle pole body component n=1 Tax=Planoprotostelium fungivorum TaxID=1890364 RepID=A0A2P6MUQ6_9EUKA|nr:gamma-tubulin complex component 4-like [Planoprotostelium fungivorum]
MFEELLGALMGFVGDRGGNLFCAVCEDGKLKTFRLSPDVDFLDSERIMIDRIVSIGALSRLISDWCQHTSRTSLEGGLYLTALRDGMRSILSEYYQALDEIDQRYKERGSESVPPVYIYNHIREHESLFHLCWKIILLIDGTPIVRGTRLLTTIYQLLERCGIPQDKSCLERLFYKMMSVFHLQLSSWTNYGILSDHFCEFFIKRNQDVTTTTSQSKNKNKERTSWYAHQLLDDMVPCFIPMKLAHSILFLGRSARLLGDHEKSQISERKLEENSTVGDKNQILTTLSLEAVCLVRRFDLQTFERVIDKIYHHKSKQLWSLLTHTSSLTLHIDAMRDYFLLFRGDFYQRFLEDSREMMSLPPKNSAQHDIQMKFQQAAVSTTAGNDPSFQNISVHFEMPKTKGSIVHAWLNVSLKYNMGWPLELLFTEQIMQEYNALFRFFLLMKRVQTDLNGVWLKFKNAGGKGSPRIPVNLWTIRRTMSYVVDKLVYYFHVDVIEAHHTTLMNQFSADSRGDFDTVQAAVRHFLSTCTFQCFLRLEPLQQILHSCLQFCDIFLNERVEAMAVKIKPVEAEFERQRSLFYDMLLGYKGHKGSSHQLPYLIMSLDKNNSV